MIQLYNSRTRQKERFRPLDPSNIRIYVCGPTVYDRAHIGNARPVVVFDVLYRLLRHVEGEGRITYARNFTDVDDKIIARARAVREEGETLEAATRRITDETISWYHDDMDALGALRPDHEPRCTEYIPEMVVMIEELIVKGHAYAAEGHVLFAVDSYDRYGALSRRPVDDMIAGARVEIAPYKRNPMDFVLWKPSTPEQPGWDSPWGRGRPGWHIECSAMARTLLGEVFDIHGGGIGLIVPHHENEIAQSCCAHDTEEMARIWMHNGFLQVEGEKMAKSAGNFFTVKDLLDRGIPGEVIRFVLLSTHYRAPLDWTEARDAEAEKPLRRWRALAADAEGGMVDGTGDGAVDGAALAALSDALNTPQAIADLHRLAHAEDGGALRASAALLGLLGDDLAGWDRVESAPEVADTIERLLAERQSARETRDFARADAIRANLDEAGVTVMDRPNAPSDWELTPNFDPARLEAPQ